MASRWLQVDVPAAKIYVAADLLRSGSRKRTKECVAAERHLYLDFDTDGEVQLTSLRVFDATVVLSIWLGKYQFLCRVDGLTFESQERALELIAIASGSDPACTACNRVFRLLGFLSFRCDPAYSVTGACPSDSTWSPDDFRRDISGVNAIAFAPCNSIAKAFRKAHQFRPRWAYLIQELPMEEDSSD